jgi:HK97 family phage portal protein
MSIRDRLREFVYPTRAAIGIHYATDGRDILVNDPDGWEVEQPWLWWNGPAGGNGTGGPWGNPPPGADGSLLVSALPAAMRATSLICDTLAGLPWHKIKGYDVLPSPRWLDDPMLLRPDATVESLRVAQFRLSHVEFWSSWITSALWYGDGFIWVPRRGRDGEPLGTLQLLHPDRVEYRDGRYWVGDFEMREGEIIHLRGQPPYDSKTGRGQGVIDRFGPTLGLARTVSRYAESTFSTGIPSGYLKVNAPNPTQTQIDTLKKSWMQRHGSGPRSIAVLNATTDFTPISISPVDAQLGDARLWSLRDVALAFGLPAYMLGAPGDPSTYANVDSRMVELRTFTLLAWMRRIEATLDAQMVRGTSLKIVADGTLRADTATRYAAYKVALDAGFMTLDEVRALEDRPPLPEEAAPEPVVEPVVPQDIPAGLMLAGEPDETTTSEEPAA